MGSAEACALVGTLYIGASVSPLGEGLRREKKRGREELLRRGAVKRGTPFCTGGNRDTNGIRTGYARDTHGIRTGYARDPHGIRTGYRARASTVPVCCVPV
jgi:hypothetical protein